METKTMVETGPLETVRLKNGSEEVASLVSVTMMSLQHLMQDKPIVLYELVEVCRDRDHKPFGLTGQDLEDLGLMNAGCVHDSIKNVVLSAVEGTGLEMTLGNPVDQAATKGPARPTA